MSEEKGEYGLEDAIDDVNSVQFVDNTHRQGVEAKAEVVAIIRNLGRQLATMTAERDALKAEVAKMAALLDVTLNAGVEPSRLELVELTAERDALEEAMHKIDNWSKAYPLDVFPEPDLKQVREVLAASGITIDCVSASMMRHVVKGVGKISAAALNKLVK